MSSTATRESGIMKRRIIVKRCLRIFIIELTISQFIKRHDKNKAVQITAQLKS